MKNILLCIILLFAALTLRAEGKWSERYNFSTLTMDDGLPHNFVDDLLKDSHGFLWIATGGGGVARYDGYEFTTFNMGSSRTKLRSNFVGHLCEDGFGRIWAVSEVGIDIIDTRSLTVTSPEQLSHPFQLILRSKAGNIWLCSKNELSKVCLDKEGNVAQVTKICDVPLGDPIRAICEVEDYLWFNYKGGIYRVKESATTQQEPALVSTALQLPGIAVQVMCRKENEMWIGSAYGLFRYNLDTELLKHYVHDPANPNSLSQNYITDIAETADHTMLVATLRGINLYNALTDDFKRISKDAPEGGLAQNTLNCDFVNCLLIDGDIVWVGTEVGGLNKMSRRMLFVQNYFHNSNIPTSLSPNPVNAIFEDPSGALWVGTVEGGLNRRAPGSNTFEHYTTNAPSHLSHSSVSCFTTDDEGRLWIGTWGGGIGWVDMNDPRHKEFHHIDAPDLGELTVGRIGSICYDRLNRLIWIVSFRDIFVYDLETDSVSQPFRGMNLGGIEGCTGYYIDKDNHLWLGLTKGLFRVNLKRLNLSNLSPESFQLWTSKLDDPDSKLAERVTYITQSRDGTIWVGSNGYGFYRASLDEHGEYQFKAYTTEDGLADNSVRCISEDKEGHLWITTTNGLSCFDPATENFSNYTRRDGLLSNQFYWNAIWRSANDDLYVGSTEGLSVVKPVIDSNPCKNVPLAFTHLRVADEERTLAGDHLQLHERDKSLYIEFAALDYNAPDFATYYYRLKGFDDRWVRVPANRRQAAYTNLRAGTYTFQLRYAPEGKQWLDQTAELHIRVLPYFYKTIWFNLLMLLLLSYIIYKVWTWRVRSLKEQQVVQFAKKEQELAVDKLAFFTNITHEFRTPLTLIVGPIERALRLSYNPQVIEQLHLVERNSKYLLSLVNQLMDFRKVEAGKMSVALNPGNFKKFLTDLLVPFDAYAAERGVTMERRFRLPVCETMYDEDAMQKLLTNLLGNALKFTPQGGKITVYAANLGSQLYLCISDTGTGIPEADLERIFDRFYQSQNQPAASVNGQSGTGIGLYLCRRVVELHGGTIRAKNHHRQGCSFRILLPISPVEALSEDKKQKLEEKSNLMTSQLLTPNFSNKLNLTILVVEDNKDMRDYIRSILRDYYTVIEASQGEEALQILTTQNVDFIISDLMMPVMDGMELSRRVKSNLAISHIPFLMLTAKTSNEARIESFRIGVDEYLLKPFDDTLLLARISNILDNRRRLQQKFTYSMNVEELNIDPETSDKKFLDRAMQIVKENYRNPDYEVTDFIEAMGVSKSLMNKKMQNLTGQSTGQFIRNYRLNIARELILHNRVTHNQNISEIAYEVGFNDPKYFTRCFTKHFNITPSALYQNVSSI